eukprot:PITA_04449
MYPGLNDTFIALIPKGEDSNTPDKYIPIALCNIIYKITSKVIATRLKPLLPLIISPEQSGYVEGRQITDGIILTHEIIHSLKQTKKPGMLLKLDLSKAFDSLSWVYIQKILIAFGFAHSWEARLLKSILSIFSDASSALINRVKSQIFFFNTPVTTQKAIGRILGFTIASLPSKYLDAPLMASALKHSSWKQLLEKLETRLSLWTNRALNMASRIVLIKAVLHSMPLYLFSILAAPKWVLKEIKNLQCNFLWGSSGQNRKWALVKWDKVCLPKKAGGIGLRDPKNINREMGAKIWWRWLAHPNTPWASL